MDKSIRSTTAAFVIAASAPALGLAQDKDAKPINVSAQATPIAVSISGAPTVVEKEELVRVATVCLTGEAAWFQRQMELTEGDASSQQESIRRCYRIVRVAEGNTAK